MSGRIKRRSVAFEKMLARVCREAGARVRTNQLVRSLNVPNVSLNDGRRIEVIADALPFYGGMQVALDATLVSPLSRDAEPKYGSEDVDGAALAHARRQKEERTYRDIASSGRCGFITSGLEVGGRWAPAFQTFVSRLAKAKARSAPKLLQTGARHWWKQRWQSMLAAAAQTAFAESLTADVMGALH